MAITTGQVIVGTAQLYVAGFGLDTPNEGEPQTSDTTEKGAAWGGNWVAMGATEQGVKITVNPKTNDITIEEQMTPADVTVQSMDIMIQTALAQDTLANMKIAYGGGTIAAQAATAEVIGKTTLTLADTLAFWSVGFEATNADGFWRRVYIPKCVSAAQVDTSYRRAAAARLYPTTIRAICDPTTIQIVEQTGAKT